MGIEEPGMSNRQGGLLERESVDDSIAKSRRIDINGGTFSREGSIVAIRKGKHGCKGKSVENVAGCDNFI